MNVMDQVLCEANKENPILAVLMGLLLDGGRLITVGSKAEELFNLVPDVIFFEKRNLEPVSEFSDFNSKDCLFVENCSVDQLLALAQSTGAQIVHISDRKTDESLVDYEITEQQLRSALLSLRPEFEKVRPLKGQVALEGSRLNKALFLDRDGVLIEDTGYVREASEVKILPGVIEGLKKARELGYKLIVITNQSGIGRGLVHWTQYEKVTTQLQNLLVQEGVYLDRILKAPYYEKSQFASGLIRKSLRKPRPGMIHQVLSEFRIDLSQSILVGDSAKDLMTGALVGVAKLYLMNSPKMDQEFEAWTRWPLASRFASLNNMKKIKSLSEIFKETNQN